jgi:two-component system chemotaxis response regulator CheY
MPRSTEMNVLVVDDDPMARLILRQILQGHLGAVVTEACNGVEAIVALDTSKFDLVLLDLEMPIMDGMTVLRAIRASDRLSSQPVIVLSASRKDENVVHSIKLGVSDYLTKPFRGREIVERVVQTLAVTARGVPPIPADA